MLMELTVNDIEIVSRYGSAVKSETKRYVIELKGLTEPVDFENPKDAGTQYGSQHLKGDGNDILLLNGLNANQVGMMERYLLTYEKESGQSADWMNTADVKRMLKFLKRMEFNDRYCSDQAYKKRALVPPGRFFKRKGEICKAVVVPVGTTYSDGVKTQRANVEGALFIVDAQGNGRITNVPTDYQTVKSKEKIKTYADALRQQQSMLTAGQSR